MRAWDRDIRSIPPAAGKADSPATIWGGFGAPASARASVPGSLVELGEAVADPVDGEEVTGRRGVRLQLASDVLHVCVDRALVRLERDAVERVEELRAGEHAPRFARERRHESELRRREIDRSAAGGHAHARDVELDVADADLLAARRWSLGAPQHRAHSGDELLRAERLRHVVVRADLETHELVGLVGTPGEHDDRDARVG